MPFVLVTAAIVLTFVPAVKVMREGGRIISIGCRVATRAESSGLADYAGTKAAIVGHSKGAARNFAQRNITVNVIQAGVIDTDIAAPLKEAARFLFSTVTIQRNAKVEKVAAGVVSLLARPHPISPADIDLDAGYSA